MKYGCIARKLSHSFSKEIHNLLFDYEYELLELEPEQVGEFLIKKDFLAVNVTIPYKQTVIPYLDFIDETAKEIGAVNTVVNKDGKLFGYNTDFLGLTSLIKRAEIEISGKKVLIAGSGGTAKTALAVAKSMNAREVFVLSRSQKEGFCTYEEAKEKHADTDVFINTTPVGMYPEIFESVIDVADYPKLSGVVDAVYNPLCSKLVCDAQEKGITAVGGLYMLVAQAAFAAEKFIDTAVPVEKIDRVYRDIFASKQNIVLVGMPSSGKTTVGKIIAEKSGLGFVDTDELIVAKEGRSIAEIFAKEGERYFRNRETEVIREIAKKQSLVIATGGGAVLKKENIELLKENGRIYFLDRPLDLLITTDDRPLSSNKADLEKRYNERYSIYLSRAHKRILNTASALYAAEEIIKDSKNENTCN